MPNRLRLDGLRELKDALRHLPTGLRDDARGVVEAHAEAAATTSRALYPIGPSRFFKRLGYHYPGGNLRAGIKVVEGVRSQFGVQYQVKSTSPHAWLFENGSELRHTAAGIARGRMPAGKVVIPTAIRERLAMYGDLRDVLTRAGLTVHGG
jgi:hypothetical protein